MSISSANFSRAVIVFGPVASNGLISVPLAGYISDQVGRVPVFRFGAVVLLVLAFPGWYLISLGNPVLVILVIGGSDSA
jgi:MFS family permease